MCGLQMTPAALVQFGCIYPDPLSDTAGVYKQPSFRQKLREMKICQLVTQEYTNWRDNYFARLMSSVNGFVELFSMAFLPYQMPDSKFATNPQQKCNKNDQDDAITLHIEPDHLEIRERRNSKQPVCAGSFLCL